MKAPTIQTDDRQAQAARVCAFLEHHPHSTQKEIDAVCDTGCISKVLSDMPDLGYRLAYGWRDVLCAGGVRKRQVRTYVLLSRPKSVQVGLFEAS